MRYILTEPQARAFAGRVASRCHEIVADALRNPGNGIPKRTVDDILRVFTERSLFEPVAMEVLPSAIEPMLEAPRTHNSRTNVALREARDCVASQIERCARPDDAMLLSEASAKLAEAERLWRNVREADPAPVWERK